MRSILLILAAAAAILVACWQIERPLSSLQITARRVAGVPVTVFRIAGSAAAPAIVIAHGFSGSQQFMQPFAATLARNGYVAVTFDFPGHARNPEPLPGELAAQDANLRALTASLDRVVALARGLPGGDGRVALLGHSMAADIVVRYGVAHPDIAATVAVSLFVPEGAARAPRNLLIIDGALEPAMLRDQGLGLVAGERGLAARPGVTYGSISDGSARRIALAAGVEHIGVLYSRDSMTESLRWLDAVFARHGDGYVDQRAPWLGLLVLGLIVLTRPLAALLPRVAPHPLGAGCRWRTLLPVAVAPAVLTPLLLWKAPRGGLPLLLGDYLVLHFAVYGLLTGAGLILLRARCGAARPWMVRAGPFALAACAAVAWATLALGAPIDRWVTSLAPIPQRVPLVLAMLAGTVPYFLADEWLTRGVGAARGGYAFTKGCFMLSLGLAVALDLPRLFFLVIIVPVIFILFAVYGLFSTWAWRRTWHPWVGALACAVAFAAFIAGTFPVVAR